MAAGSDSAALKPGLGSPAPAPEVGRKAVRAQGGGDSSVHSKRLNKFFFLLSLLFLLLHHS